MSRKPIDLSTLPVPDRKWRRASFFAPVQRFWVRHPFGGEPVRWLQVDRYDDEGNNRCFICCLHGRDSRPRGIELCKTSKGGTPKDRAFYYRNYGLLPKGVWIEVVYADNPARPVVALIAEHAVNREDAA